MVVILSITPFPVFSFWDFIIGACAATSAATGSPSRTGASMNLRCLVGALVG